MPKLLLIALLLVSSSGRACSWVTLDTFCGRAEELAGRGDVGQAVVRLRGKTVRWEARADGTYYAPVFEVQILQTVAGGLRAGQTIFLWSGDRWDCNGPIDYIEPGAEYLVGFAEVPTDRSTATELAPGTPAGLYQLWGFGGLVYQIFARDGQEIVYPVEFNQEAVSVEQLLARIAPCHGGPDPQLELYPNPATEWVRASFAEQRVLGAEVYDGRGRLVSRGYAGASPTTLLQLNVRHWQTGMYYLILRLEDGLYRRRFLVH